MSTPPWSQPPGASGRLHPPPAQLLARPRRGSSLFFTLLVSAALLVGGLIMAFVLLASGAPRALVVGTVLAVVPVVPVLACFLWLDRYEPEPRGLLVTALAWGAVVATAGALIFQGLGSFVFGGSEQFAAAVMAPVTEEFFKGAFVVLLLWLRRHELDGVLDGIVYAGFVGVGFAFTENILYLASAHIGESGAAGGLSDAVAVFILRCLMSPFAHPLFTVFIGIAAGYAVHQRSRTRAGLLLLGGYSLAVAFHALWNGSALLGDGSAFLGTYVLIMFPTLIALMAFAIWVRARERAMLTTALRDAAQRGFVSAEEITYLTDLRARRQARQHAEAAGGEPFGLAMREYQEQAIQLAFLHSRFLRGVPPRDAQTRGTLMVQRLAALRPYVLFPQSTYDSRL